MEPMRRRTLWMSTCLALAVSCVAPRASAQGVRSIEVYATTDLHGHMEPHAVRLSGPGPARFSERGGLAVIGGFLKNARAHFPGRVLLLDGGDMFQGTLASNLTEGAAMLRGLNALGYAAVALGNHEFDYGPIGDAATPTAPSDDPRGALKARIREAKFPVLAANLVTPAGEQLVTPYTLTEVDGVPIAIIGGTSESLFQTTMRPNLEGLKVEQLAPAILRAAGDATKRGARLVIALVHAGAECARGANAITWDARTDLSGCSPDSESFKLAEALAAAAREGGPRVHAIIGGHTHQPITAVVDGIPIMQAGKNGHVLAHLSIEVRGRGKDATPTGHFGIERVIELCARVRANGECALVDDKSIRPANYFGNVVPDAAITAAIAADLKRAKEVAGRPIGVELPSGLSAAYGEESPLGNYAADTMRAVGKADVGFTNGGGLRADLPPGPVTYGSLYESFPFENEVVTVELAGALLRRMVLRNLGSRYGALSYSGLRVSAECKDGQMRADITIGERPLELARKYKVATLDFLLRGGDGALPPPVPAFTSHGRIRELVEAALHEHGGTLRPSERGLYDRAHPRVSVRGGRPLRCPLPADVEASDRAASP